MNLNISNNKDGVAMTSKNLRYIQMDDWIFEVKTVRAHRVDKDSKAFTATANCNINGDGMYIDSLLTKDQKEFSKEDFMTFNKFSEKMGLKEVTYHRYHHGESASKTIKVGSVKDGQSSVSAQTDISPVRLVK